MSRVVLFNKPFGVLTQFSPADGRKTLADFIPVPGVYPAGRLDADSEGLLILTDDGALQARIAEPRFKRDKCYLAQVEGSITDDAVKTLKAGIDLGDFKTQPAQARRINEPPWLWQRDPPIRYRKAIPTSWLELSIREGKNRQVRRMTASVGFPTLRLIRWSVGEWTLAGLEPGEWREIEFSRQPDVRRRVIAGNAPKNRGVE